MYRKFYQVGFEFKMEVAMSDLGRQVVFLCWKISLEADAHVSFSCLFRTHLAAARVAGPSTHMSFLLPKAPHTTVVSTSLSVGLIKHPELWKSLIK